MSVGAGPAGDLAVVAATSMMTLALASDRFGWSLLPVAYRVRPPRD